MDITYHQRKNSKLESFKKTFVERPLSIAGIVMRAYRRQKDPWSLECSIGCCAKIKTCVILNLAKAIDTRRNEELEILRSRVDCPCNF